MPMNTNMTSGAKSGIVQVCIYSSWQIIHGAQTCTLGGRRHLLRNGIGVRERPIGKKTQFFTVLVDGVGFRSVLDVEVLCSSWFNLVHSVSKMLQMISLHCKSSHCSIN